MCTQLDWPEQLQSPWDQDPPPSDPLYGGPAVWAGNLIDTHKDGLGYVYMRNRYYDPSSGRFTQEDPIGLAGGLNAYGFANGDPVNYSDPFGLTPWWIGLLVRLTMATAAVTDNTTKGYQSKELAKQMAETDLKHMDADMLKTVKETGVEIVGRSEGKAAIEGAAKAGTQVLARGAAKEGTSLAVKGVIGIVGIGGSAVGAIIGILLIPDELSKQ